MTSIHPVKHTLFLWPEGFFPKRIVYLLLAKGLCSSMDQLVSGKTNDNNLRVINITYDGKRLQSSDPSEPKPEGKSIPCIRIDRGHGEPVLWLTESATILGYLDDAWGGFRSLQPEGLVLRAMAEDIRNVLVLADADSNDWLLHAAPVMAGYKGVPDSERNLKLAQHYLKDLSNKMFKIQTLAEASLAETGWLTACSHRGPGLLDVILAASQRFVEISWGVNWLEDTRLQQLRDWYERFKGLAWWDEVEEAGRMPVSLRAGPNRIVERLDG